MAASISGDIVYSISNLKWMDGWTDSYSYRGRFSCTDHATFRLLCTLYRFMCGVCVLHAPCCWRLGVSLTSHVRLYVRSLCYTPSDICLREFLLQIHTLCYFIWGVCLKTVFCFIWGVCLTHPVLYDVGNLSYRPWAILCGTFV